MDILSGIIFVTLTTFAHYNLFGFCMIIWVCIRIRTNGHSFGAMSKSVLAFCISGFLLIGLPLTIIKMNYPEMSSPRAEAGAMKEVQEWFGH
jgi:hypothetical protein